MFYFTLLVCHLTSQTFWPLTHFIMAKNVSMWCPCSDSSMTYQVVHVNKLWQLWWLILLFLKLGWFSPTKAQQGEKNSRKRLSEGDSLEPQRFLLSMRACTCAGNPRCGLHPPPHHAQTEGSVGGKFSSPSERLFWVGNGKWVWWAKEVFKTSVFCCIRN